MSKYGKAIRIIRQKQGVSQRELGRKSGVSRGDISLYENGKQGLTMDTMLKLMRALDYEIVLKPCPERKYNK